MSKKKNKDSMITFDTVYWSNVTARGGISLLNSYEICQEKVAPFLFYGGDSLDVCQIRVANDKFRIVSYPFTASEAAIRKKIVAAGGIAKLAEKLGISPTAGPVLVNVEHKYILSQENFVLDMPKKGSHPLFLSVDDVVSEKELSILTVRGDFNSDETMYLLHVQSYASRYISRPWMGEDVEPLSRDVIGSLVYAHYGIPIPKVKTTAIYAKIRCNTDYEFPQNASTVRLYELFHGKDVTVELPVKSPVKGNILLSELAMVGVSEVMKAVSEEKTFPHSLVMDTQAGVIDSVTLMDAKNISISASDPGISNRLGYYRNIWMAPSEIKITLVVKEA